MIIYNFTNNVIIYYLLLLIPLIFLINNIIKKFMDLKKSKVKICRLS